MRAPTLVAALASVGLAWAPAAAQEVETLKKEVEQLKRQLQSLVSQAPPSGQPTLTDLARPRPPFSLAERRGGGQILFDIGLAGDFVANVTQSNVERAGGGTFAGLENRFFPREVELSLFGQIDPYASGVVRIEGAEETRAGELAVHLAEAHLTLLTLPLGTQARLGLMRNRFGYSNEHHAHDLPWIDRPNAFRIFFGDEGLNEKGLEATIIPDLPFYLEGLVGIFNGDNVDAFGRSTLRRPLTTGRLRTFFEPGTDHGLLLGMSVASGHTDQRNRSTILGWEGRYKYRPEGWLHPLVTLTGEALYSMRKADVAVDVDADGAVDRIDKRQRDRFGWYTGLEVQPIRRWAGGVRYDSSQYPVNPGREWSVEPYVTFWPSEFLRFRLGYKRTDRSTQTREAFNLNDASARMVDELLFQATFILGAHPAHPF
jgi:hypothetical protein